MATSRKPKITQPELQPTQLSVGKVYFKQTLQERIQIGQEISLASVRVATNRSLRSRQ